jgi:hypothetical protein
LDQSLCSFDRDQILGPLQVHGRQKQVWKLQQDIG